VIPEITSRTDRQTDPQTHRTEKNVGGRGWVHVPQCPIAVDTNVPNTVTKRCKATCVAVQQECWYFVRENEVGAVRHATRSPPSLCLCLTVCLSLAIVWTASRVSPRQVMERVVANGAIPTQLHAKTENTSAQRLTSKNAQKNTF